MYRRDLRDQGKDGLLADMATADLAVQAAPAPNGERIGYVKNREDQSDIWMLDDGQDVRLTSGGVTAQRYGRGDPQWFDWSPSGDRIAYLTATGCLAAVDVETGDTAELTSYDDPVRGLAWGAPGIAVVTDHFSRASLALVDPDSGSIDVLADDEFLYGDPRWGGDAVYATRSRHRDLFDYETALARITPGAHTVPELLFHEDAVRVQNPRPHPDGRGVAFVHDATGYDALYYLPADGDEPELVYALDDTEVADPAWHPDGDRLAVTATHHGRVNVHLVTLDGDGEALTRGDHKHTAPGFHEGDVVTVRDSPVSPPVVWNGSTGERLSPAASAGFEARLPAPEDITYESAGQTVHAVVFPPAAEAALDSVPLLVKPHGGPTTYDGFGWNFRAQYFAALGYAVVLPNYRGSDGFGRAFRMANDESWGEGDLEDVIAVADAVADEYGSVDGDRVGIFGGSGGGLMTVNALGNADRFRAGAAFYGVYDYESFVNDTDDIGWQLLKRELGDLATDLDNYREASPIRHTENVEDPLLVLHGEEDDRVPISQSEQLVDELEQHGKRHEFQRYDEEPHGFSKRENVVDAYTRCADLFAKYLQVDPDEGSSQPHSSE